MTGARFQQQLWGEMVRPWPCFVFRLPACCPCPPSPIMVILLILTTQCLSILNRKWFEKSNCVFLNSDFILFLIECSDQEASSPVSSSSCGPVIECSQQWLWKEAGWWKKAGSKTSNDGSWAEGALKPTQLTLGFVSGLGQHQADIEHINLDKVWTIGAQQQVFTHLRIIKSRGDFISKSFIYSSAAAATIKNSSFWHGNIMWAFCWSPKSQKSRTGYHKKDEWKEVKSVVIVIWVRWEHILPHIMMTTIKSKIYLTQVFSLDIVCYSCWKSSLNCLSRKYRLKLSGTWSRYKIWTEIHGFNKAGKDVKTWSMTAPFDHFVLQNRLQHFVAIV